MKYFIPLLLVLFVSCGETTQTTITSVETEKISDEDLLTFVQKETFKYFWEGGEPNSGAARERIHPDGVYPLNDKNVVASGGTGFGLMAILVAIERGFVNRGEAVERIQKILNFLSTADRYHGAWGHWIYGKDGKTKAFSKRDDGGDIVETSYLAQGLLCVRQFFKDGDKTEKELADLADELWRGIEWNWYRGANKENVIFWHWSPNFDWQMNFRIRGYNECLITYVLAASSPTHPVPPEVYHEGWAENGNIASGPQPYNIPLDFKHQAAPKMGGPLFWAHYSFMGLNPHGLIDKYGDYWRHNINHVLVNRAYCIDNPKNYKGYSEKSWGLTSSYSPTGYVSHKPERDSAVISPTAALSSFPYTPQESMEFLRYLYEERKEDLLGPYGFYDAYSPQKNWIAKKYLAIDQGPIIVMIENYRSGLMWKLFMSSPEVQNGLKKLGFDFKAE